MRRHPRQQQNESKEDQSSGIEAVIHLHVETPPASFPSTKAGSTTTNSKNRGFSSLLFLDKSIRNCSKKSDNNNNNNNSRRNYCGGLIGAIVGKLRQYAKPILALISIAALAGGTFWLASRYPCLYLCSWWKSPLPKPPPPPERTYEERVEFVETQVKMKRQYVPVDNKGGDGYYDIYDCPMEPPPNYPLEFPIMDVLNHWPVTDTELHDERTIHQGFCVFDFARHSSSEDAEKVLHQQIQAYRKAEKPFVVKNDPEVLKTVERWNTNDYLDYKLQRKIYRGEFSKTLSMMYWSLTRGHKVPKDFVPPTKMRPTTFEIWKRRALAMEDETLAAKLSDENSYLRFDGCEQHKRCDALHRNKWPFGGGIYAFTKVDDANFLQDELPWFSPRYYDKGISKDYMIEPKKNRGIQCRFGAKGLVAEDHFDNERNFIAVLGGERRYILGHPNNCKDMELYPMAHPLERHSKVDWNAPNLTEHPNFERVHVNEVVLQAGDILYLPTYWFHHIVSLNMNYQCNARSGHSLEYDQEIFDCGFLYPWPAV